MGGVDVYATQRLAELLYVLDEDGGIPSPKRAAMLLGVEPGCGVQAAQSAVQIRFGALLSQLAPVAPDIVAHGFRALAEIADAAARPAPIWSPLSPSSTPVGTCVAGGSDSVSSCRGGGGYHSGVRVARALGLRDLKRPRRLIGHEVAGEVLQLNEGSSCVVLLSDGARRLTEERVAEICKRHFARPRAACVRLASAAEAPDGEAVGALTMSISVTSEIALASSRQLQSSPAAAAVADSRQGSVCPESAAKRRRHQAGTDGSGADVAAPAAAAFACAASSGVAKEPGGRPPRIRIAQVLLKYVGIASSDPHARRPAPTTRTQAEAERQLLGLLEGLLSIGDAKSLSARFAEACRELSDCKSAINTPHADLGWVTPGQWGRDFDAVAFELPVGGLSDILVTQRGMHLLHRLA